jgi:hypothetical protein
MDVKKNKIALIVHSCDRYKFLYKGFQYFFSKNWDFNINCNYYFATEEINVIVPGFQNIKSGKGEWSDRLAILLKEKIKEDYILYFQEDMWLTKKVNPKFFNQLFELALEKKWKQIKLNSSEVYSTKETEFFIEGFNVSEINNKESGFLMSHQVTLWQKDFLIAQLYKNEHPWRNERKGTKRMKKLDPVIYHIDFFAENGKKEINNNKEPIGRSEYQTISVNGVLNENVKPFIDILMSEENEYGDYAKELKYHYDNNLTHDGKPKPRKVGSFKKMKNWLFQKKSL